MDYWERKVIREQLDKKFEVLKSFVGFYHHRGGLRPFVKF